MRPVSLLSVLLFAFGMTAATGHSHAQGDVERGRKLSEQHCSRCHVVGDYNRTGGISSTPSFQLLVNRRPDYQYRFQTFFDRPPHPAFVSLKGEKRHMDYLPANAAPLEVSEADIEDIAAFVETMKSGEEGGADEPLVYRPRPKPRMR